MSPSRALALVAVALATTLAACEPSPLPAPRVVSVSPDQMLSSGTANVEVTVEAILHFQVDYNLGKVTAERLLLLSIGTLLVPDSRYENNGVLTAFVPSIFDPGVYDVTITLVENPPRVGILEQAFTVNPGQWPAGYSIDPIPSQTQNVPFAITIRATGVNAATFEGTVDLLSTDGPLSLSHTGPFTAGVRVQNVVVSARTPRMVISVRDRLGTMAASNAFNVN